VTRHHHRDTSTSWSLACAFPNQTSDHSLDQGQGSSSRTSNQDLQRETDRVQQCDQWAQCWTKRTDNPADDGQSAELGVAGEVEDDRSAGVNSDLATIKDVARLRLRLSSGSAVGFRDGGGQTGKEEDRGKEAHGAWGWGPRESWEGRCVGGGCLKDSSKRDGVGEMGKRVDGISMDNDGGAR
jgi:hypothetical protein